jgi:hypothetical protein
MPPSCGEPAAAQEELPALAADAFAVLPPPLRIVILACLPVDERARAAAVCRAWRAALADPAPVGAPGRHLRKGLDFFQRGHVTDAFLSGAAARAGGQLQSLTVPLECLPRDNDPAPHNRALLRVLAANAGTLPELRTSTSLELPLLTTLLGAAPHLHALHAPIFGTAADLQRMLSGEPPLGPHGPLRATFVSVYGRAAREEEVVALAAALASHRWVQQLSVFLLPLRTRATLDALVDACVRHSALASMELTRCPFSVESAPGLARLLLTADG